MMNSSHIRSALLLTVLSALLVGCGGSKSDDTSGNGETTKNPPPPSTAPTMESVAGSYEIDRDSTRAKTTEAAHQATDEFAMMALDATTKLLDNGMIADFEFLADGTLTAEFGLPDRADSLTGTWSLNDAVIRVDVKALINEQVYNGIVDGDVITLRPDIGDRGGGLVLVLRRAG